MPANLENSAVATGLEKVSFHSNLKEGQCQRMLKLPSVMLISHASKLMLKVLQARHQQCVNCEHPDVQAGFRKDAKSRDQIANIHWIIKSISDKTTTSILLTTLKPLCGSQQTGKFFKRWKYQTT